MAYHGVWGRVCDAPCDDFAICYSWAILRGLDPSHFVELGQNQRHNERRDVNTLRTQFSLHRTNKVLIVSSTNVMEN